MPDMRRTTVTLDADAEALVRKRMRERNLSFKQAINEAIRSGLAADAARPREFRTPTRSLGEPKVDLTKALALAGQMEDEEILRKLAAGK